MNTSEKNRFDTHFQLLLHHYDLDQLPYVAEIKDLSKNDYITKCYEHGIKLGDFSDDDFETFKSISIFFDQRGKMSFKEFNKALIEEYADTLNFEKDVREVEKFNVLNNIDRNIKTMRGIMVFFLVMWILGIVVTIIYALSVLT
jgi:hypothetical protein